MVTLGLLDIILIGIVCSAMAADFCLGHAGRERLNLRLMRLWDRFDDIKVPQVGVAEISSCLSTLDRLLSPRAFSLRRLASCLLLNAIFVVVFYIIVESYRLTSGLSVRAPFISPHHYTNWPVTAIIGMFSISISRFILGSSARLCRNINSRWSILYFVGFILLSFYILLMLSVLISYFVYYIPFTFINGIYTREFKGGVHSTLISVTWNNFGELLKAWWDIGKAITRNEFDWIAHVAWRELPSLAVDEPLRYVYSAAGGDDQRAVTEAYTGFSLLMFSYLRIAFAVIFFGTWALLRPAYRATELLFRRLLEEEKGPLSTLALLGTAFAKLIELLIKL
jgi:hypothetical protein